MLRFIIHLAIGVICVGLDRRYGIVGLTDLSVWIFFLLLFTLASTEILLKAGKAEAEADLQAAVLIRRLHLLRVQGRTFQEAIEFLAAGRTGETDLPLQRLSRDLNNRIPVRRAARSYGQRIGSPLARKFLPALIESMDSFPQESLDFAESSAEMRAAPEQKGKRNNGLLLIQGFWLSTGLALYVYAAYTIHQYISTVFGGVFKVLNLPG